MNVISLQMIDHHITSFWWKELVKYFVQVGDNLEIRCWREESAEIQQASLYGSPTEDHYEVYVKGVVSEDLITELLSENPTDKSIYNKMTKYFTINVNHEQRRFCSAHYGTELYLIGVSEDDITYFKNIMNAYSEEDFSVYIER